MLSIITFVPWKIKGKLVIPMVVPLVDLFFINVLKIKSIFTQTNTESIQQQ